MRVMLLASAFNSLTQRVHAELRGCSRSAHQAPAAGPLDAPLCGG